MNRLTLFIVILLCHSATSAVHADDEDQYSLAINYLTAPGDDQSTFDISFTADIGERTSLNMSYQNIQVDEEIIIPDFAGNEVDAQVLDIGIEHWLANQTIGFGLGYNRWDDDNQLKNNDLTATLFYQTENWLWGLDAINRDLELALAVLVPGQGIRTFTRDNDALGYGISALYGGWENWLVSFEHQKFDYDERTVDNPRFAQIQRLPYISNNPLIEETTGAGLAYLFDNGQLISFDISFDKNLLARSDSSTYALNYSFPLSDALQMDLGAAHIDQDEDTSVFSLGFSWGF